jgi:hypothetical protein
VIIGFRWSFPCFSLASAIILKVLIEQVIYKAGCTICPYCDKRDASMIMRKSAQSPGTSKLPSGKAGPARCTPSSPTSARAVANTEAASRPAVRRGTGKTASSSVSPTQNLRQKQMDSDTLEEVNIPENMSIMALDTRTGESTARSDLEA